MPSLHPANYNLSSVEPPAWSPAGWRAWAASGPGNATGRAWTAPWRRRSGSRRRRWWAPSSPGWSWSARWRARTAPDGATRSTEEPPPSPPSPEPRSSWTSDICSYVDKSGCVCVRSSASERGCARGCSRGCRDENYNKKVMLNRKKSILRPQWKKMFRWKWTRRVIVKFPLRKKNEQNGDWKAKAIAGGENDEKTQPTAV